MRTKTRKSLLLAALACMSGCAANREYHAEAASWPATKVAASEAGSIGSAAAPRPVSSHACLGLIGEAQTTNRSASGPDAKLCTHDGSGVRPASHASETSLVPEGTLIIDGRQYRVQLVEEPSGTSPQDIVPLLAVSPAELKGVPASSTDAPNPTPAPTLPPNDGVPIDVSSAVTPTPIAGGTSLDLPPAPLQATTSGSHSATPVDALRLDLASVLGAVGGSHPAVGAAQWRVQEAYARVDAAEVLWLPSLRLGTSFHRHDGNYQASNGEIVDISRTSLQAGLGVGATGAGTTTRPGIVSEFHVADAIFQPRIACKNAWAAGHASNAVYNRQLLDAALAYLDLLEAEQDAVILRESRTRTNQLVRLTADFADAGEGLQADADRMRTELALIDSRLAEADERIAVASARLVQAMSLPPGQKLRAADPVVTQIHLVSPGEDRGALIATGLAARPELQEAQALVAAACDEWKRQKYAPLVPSVLLGFSSGGFGGSVKGGVENFDERYDFDAIVAWEVRNLGFGEKAARRQTAAQFERAKYEKLRVLDQVAREIDEAFSRVELRRERVAIAERAIQSALDSFDRNVGRIRDGEGLPIEVLQSVTALESARRNYLRAVADYNDAQFELQWALGWPVNTPPGHGGRFGSSHQAAGNTGVTGDSPEVLHSQDDPEPTPTWLQ